MSTTLQQLDPQSTALVLIDLQQGITAMPTEPYSSAEVIANAAQLTDAFHAKGMTVIFVRVTFAKDGKDMLRPESDEPMMRAMNALPENWAEIVPQLKMNPDDLLITKRQWGAFYGTELDLELRRRGIKTLVMGGIATNYGVESTARDAYERGYQLIFASDAMASRVATDHFFALDRIFPRIGRIRTSKEVLAAIG